MVLGSVLYVIGFSGFILAVLVTVLVVLVTVRSGGRGALWGIPFFLTGRALMDAGGRLGLGRRFGLGWGWVSLAAAALALWMLLTSH